MNHFLFLYPTTEYMDYEIEQGARLHRALLDEDDGRFDNRWKEISSEEERVALLAEIKQFMEQTFREEYGAMLNACIDLRYRKKGFQINYALFDDTEVSDKVILQPTDNIIRVGLDYVTHTTKVDGEYPYPNQDYILDQLGQPEKLRVAGFHEDCVGKLARRAYERGMDVLVDEDLTEFFISRIRRPDFRLDTYPSVDRRSEIGPELFEISIELRRDKPWLLRDY
ncbi:MAG: hypothetical protein ABIE94_02550 [archaeon]